MQSPSLPPPLRRIRWKIVAAATAVTLAAAGLTALQTPSLAAAAPTKAPAAAIKATHTVTLITGDRVVVTTLADGKQTVEVDRPDNATGGVRLHESGGDLLVLPDEAMPLLTANKLDRRLFNVTDLIEMGYDDAKSSGVPLIATFAPAKTRGTKPAAPQGSKVVRDLASIGGAALNTDKRQTRTFWNDIAPAESLTLGAGVTKLWLDGKVKANLKESVPLVGAPEAWAAGYNGAGVKVAVLDTGIDSTHPDLAGQIDDMVSFVPGETVADINGHGTHVASTIVGTGAASSGDHKGVAPGADLIVGKVLGGTNGYGDDSWVLAGMQWAAESGADIINMSLGGGPTDGTDPMSLAVDALSAQYGALFVIASGNTGPETVSSPGTAASALTVGATDKQDGLAYFTSTGPVWGTGAIKPDISAPGMDIMAAWSHQAAVEPGLYRSISGTSMATPHVAGAAAIVAQQHPEWSGQRIKNALMSNAKPLADWYTPFEVGTGRLDIAATVRGTVQATGSVSLGNFDWPHEPGDAPVSKPVTFTNSGPAAVTLNLAINGTGPFSLGAPSVTIPAGGSADVSVTGDPTAPGFGRYTGYIVGTDAATGQAVTRTSIALVKEDERYNLTIKLRDRAGQPASGQVIMNVAGERWSYFLQVDGEATFRLPPATYTFTTSLDVSGEHSDSLGSATLVDPETIHDKTSEVVLDASKARLLDTTAPQSTEDRQRRVDYQIDFNQGGRVRSALQVPVKYDNLYLSPTEPMISGTFDATTRWRKGEKMLSLRAFGLLPFDATVQPGSTVTAGQEQLKAVYAGFGSAADFAKVDASGKLVVVTRSDAVPAAERTANAIAAGAKLLIVVNDGLGILNEWVGESAIPVATVHRDAGALLVYLAKSGALKLTAKQVPYATYLYDLTRNYPGQVPNRELSYHPSRSDLARIDANYYSHQDQEGSGYRYDMTFSPSIGFRERESHPGTRTEWVTPAQVWHETHQQGTWDDVSYMDAYVKGTTTRLNWFAPAIRPAFTRAFAVQNGRYRDYMTINVQSWSSSGNDGLEHGGNMEWGSVPNSVQLYQGDTLIDQNNWNSDLQWAEVPPGKLPYRVVVDASRPDEWRLSTRTHTEWDFVSESNNADDFVPFSLLQLNYALATDLRGDVKAGKTHDVSIAAGPQSGGSGTGNVTSVTLEVSYDDGATWQKVKLLKGTNGKWNAQLKLAGQPGGFVSVRASATTDSGFAIRQEIIRAYGLN